MGFGAGLQSEGRRESILGSDVHGGWVAQPFALPASFTRVLVLTPLGTPSAYDGVVRGDTHAFRLVTLVRISEGVVITQRTVLGDARDLLVRVLRRALDSRLPPSTTAR